MKGRQFDDVKAVVLLSSSRRGCASGDDESLYRLLRPTAVPESQSEKVGLMVVAVHHEPHAAIGEPLADLTCVVQQHGGLKCDVGQPCEVMME